MECGQARLQGACLVRLFRRGKPSSAEPVEISDHLQDLQALFTRAARAGRGGFLWCGWNACQWTQTCKKIRTTSPSTGAQLSMMTAKCARELLPLWHQVPNMHMGSFFKFRMGLEWQEKLGCSYVWPPIGGFFTHPSTTVGKSEARVLHSHFESKWAQEGTRALIPAHHHRWIVGFTEKGPAHWLEKVPVILPEDLPSCRWITCAPPGTPAWQCGWRSYHEFWRRSEELTEDLGNCVKCVVLWV